jgi:Zn finger protein HypA/HybF involved in hydrogenase expression
MKTYLCPECGSDNIQLDASAAWDTTEQEWVLSGTYDEGWCNECGTTNIDTHKFRESKVETKPNEGK